MNKYILLFTLLFVYTYSFSQTEKDRSSITNSYDQKEIEKVKSELKRKEQIRQEILDKYLNKNSRRVMSDSLEETGLPISINDNGEIIYLKTFNEGSAKTINERILISELAVDGKNMYAGVWDEALPRTTHQDFKNAQGEVRIEKGSDNVQKVSKHSTHVTGTIIGGGYSPAADNLPQGYSKGMAPNAHVKSFDYSNDLSEMTEFAQKGYLVSNHSYGISALNAKGRPVFELNSWVFGAYDFTSYKLDQLAYLNKYYQMVIAAGNDRENYLKINPEKDGYELILNYGVAKNVLTIGAVEEIINYNDPKNVKISTFSNFGPTDDGRIKPNIVAKGVSVYSTGNLSDNSYIFLNGTSMATPSITGSILLLQQYNHKLNSKYLTSASIRGLLQHSAKEAGSYDGPDYIYGWGLADIGAAAQIITDKNKKSILEENQLNNRSTYIKKIKASGAIPLQISISWTDPENKNYNGDILGLSTGKFIAGVKDPDQVNLVNDLDIKVTQINNEGQVIVTYYPWRLNKFQPSLPAKNDGTNDVDNFERIDIPNPNGEYLITISHKGNLTNNSQDYTLIVTGPSMETVETVEEEFKLQETKVYPIPSKDYVYIYVMKNSTYKVYGTSGNLYLTGTLIEGENKIDTSSLSSGIYFVRINDGKNNETKKIIVQ
ncbi:T9SS type A sorting domain-containing protein [Apibacter muscae]|uniref:T9SS type A sorting domain-containing protein n=1 Tax=Apibacter muscae TaxID=2509004 RepID=A0A563DIY6_9FLAO|nr:S8 family serine peptidase [Apibacter muscae]TWP29833.1 T9SS type A sorting domain-containing protein [Apibacter muscae]